MAFADANTDANAKDEPLAMDAPEEENVYTENDEIYENIIGCENIKDMLGSLDNRFVFLYHGVEKPEHMREVNLLGQYVNSMR